MRGSIGTAGPNVPAGWRPGSVIVVETTTAPAATPAIGRRSRADLVMRRILLLPTDQYAPGAGAESLFGKSILISAVRCLITYIVVPVLAPIIDLTTSVGPAVGLAVGAISTIAIVAATRRFFAADHRFRWPYAAIGGSILGLLIVQAVFDVSALL